MKQVVMQKYINNCAYNVVFSFDDALLQNKFRSELDAKS